VLHDTIFVKSADELIDEARSAHPRLLSLRAEVDAAEAGVSAMRAEGRPSVVLSAEAVRTSQENQLPSAGYQPTDINNRNSAIGVQINIPLFEGFSRSYKVQSAKSQVEAKEAEYAATEKQVMLEVWKGYQVLGAETQNLDTTQDLLGNARKSFEVARGRYKEGWAASSNCSTSRRRWPRRAAAREDAVELAQRPAETGGQRRQDRLLAISGLFEKGGRKRR
jgi:outer membrane protein